MPLRRSELIGQLLVQKGLITIEQLERALVEQESSGGLLGTILIKLGFVTEELLYKVLAEQFDKKYIKLKDLKIPHSTIEEIPAKFATHYKLIPIRFEKNVITVAMSNPLDIHTLDDLKLLLKKEIKTVLASESDIVEAIKKYYGVGAETIEKITPEVTDRKPLSVQSQVTEDIARSAEDASIIKFVNQILLEAYKDRATDIHIEPYGDELKIRYRVDGILYDTKIPPNIKSFQSAIISRIKVMANLDIAERRLPQDGRIKIKIAKDEVDLRISLLPTPFGEAVVIRLLSTNVLYGLGNLGLLKRDLEIFEKLIKAPHGIIFVTGPTGSGKTTTLYAALSKINDKEKKILTIEDPIEYQMKGITQIQVYPKIGLTFSNGLRTMLRHDPDIMMVGEVRDYETAEITIRVALTGHLVFSTLHTNDAAGGITRLVDMGVEPFLVASSVNAFLAQRLVRVICPECKRESKPDKEILRELEVTKKEALKVKMLEGKGCESCKYTGYKGRTAIYEVLVVTEEIRKVILDRAASDEIKRKAVSLGMHTLRQDGWQKVKMGITTPSEVIRVTQQEEHAE
ncbi:MAG: Flp pilus assembly complex ATPase component TadA [Candidatus Omnitrophica bacterium]|nr:Flp pilus assembly complex ATPase component TadA [Candidatus Omnitrophota bacterium]